MRILRLVLVFLWLLSGRAASAQLASWTEGTIIGVPTDNSKTTLIYIQENGANPAGNLPPMALPILQWHTITFAHLPPQYIPPHDVKAIGISGTLVSSGGPPVYCSMILTFRAPGSNLSCWDYQGIAVSSLPGGAFRQNLALVVPVVNGAFEFCWFYSNPECPMIVNLSLQSYVR